jgi:two-component SAPR family response regulator
MKTVIIDPEPSGMTDVFRYLRNQRAKILGIFESLSDGYDFILQNKPDIIFIGIDSLPSPGCRTGSDIRKALPKTAIVYVARQSYAKNKVEKTRSYDYILMPFDVSAESMPTYNAGFNAASDYDPVIKDVPLSIKCFGNFMVYAGEQDVKFATQKVRELLAYLLSCYKQRISKQDILGAIFNSGDEKKDINNFRVTLHRLRRALMYSGVKKDDLLIREDLSLVIAPGISDLTELNEFIDKNRTINMYNLNRAMQIIELAEGELFANIDTLWATEARSSISEKVDKLTLKTAECLMELDTGKKRGEQYLLTLLEKNDLLEKAYMLLMDYYIREKDDKQFKAIYKRYTKIVRFDLGTKPLKRYAEYYLCIRN